MKKLINDCCYIALGLLLGLGAYFNVYQNPVMVMIATMLVGGVIFSRFLDTNEIKLTSPSVPQAASPALIAGALLKKNPHLEEVLGFHVERKKLEPMNNSKIVDTNVVDLAQYRKNKNFNSFSNVIKVDFNRRSDTDPEGA